MISRKVGCLRALTVIQRRRCISDSRPASALVLVPGELGGESVFAPPRVVWIRELDRHLACVVRFIGACRALYSRIGTRRFTAVGDENVCIAFGFTSIYNRMACASA